MNEELNKLKENCCWSSIEALREEGMDSRFHNYFFSNRFSQYNQHCYSPSGIEHFTESKDSEGRRRWENGSKYEAGRRFLYFFSINLSHFLSIRRMGYCQLFMRIVIHSSNFYVNCDLLYFYRWLNCSVNPCIFIA